MARKSASQKKCLNCGHDHQATPDFCTNITCPCKSYQKRPKFKQNTNIQVPNSGTKLEINNQYLKFINANLAHRLSRIKKMKKKNRGLEHEIEILKSDDLTNLVWLPKISIDELDGKEIEELKHYFSLQADITKFKLDFFKDKIKKVQTELTQQETQLSQLNRHINEKNYQPNELQK